MDYHKLVENLKNIENETMELKSSFNDWDSIGKTIAAFSTKRGGKIYVGVNNSGCPIGTICSKDAKDKITNLSRTITPPAIVSTEIIKHDSEKDLDIVIINIEGGKGVYSYKNIAYERRDGINHPLSLEEAFELQKQSKKIYFDEMPAFSNDRPALISDIDESKIKHFLENTKGIGGQIDAKKFLQNHELLYNGGMQVKNAAVMIFGKDVKKFIPQSKISICEFKSENIADDFIKTEIEGDLTTILKRTIFEIQKRMTTYSFIRGFQRIDIQEYPEEALKEAITNAVIHRDYFDDMEIFIKIFKDRIEILNPVKFPFQNWTWEEIEKTGSSVKRNPRCAEFFEGLSLMEKEGTGLGRIKQKTSEHGLPPPKIEVGEKTFKITIYNQQKNPSKLLVSPYRIVRDAMGLNERQQKVLEYLQKNNLSTISRGDYMKILNVPEKTATRDLNDLVGRELLERAGSKRGARYFVIWQR